MDADRVERKLSDPTHYLTTEEAGAVLRLEPQTLRRYRSRGTGPVFYRFGNRVRYTLEDLAEFARGKRFISCAAADAAEGRTRHRTAAPETGA